MSRTLAIGDIHGAYKALVQLMERIQPQPEDHLIFLGDYVDGWSQSLEVIDYLIDLSKNVKCDFILGNHDEWCHDWLRGMPPDATWLQHGGRSTMYNYQSREYDREAHLRFFRECQNYFIDVQNRLFIHAGFTSMHGPAREHHTSNFRWDRTLWEAAMTADGMSPHDPAYPERLKHFTEIYIGHTPVTRWERTKPWLRANVWNVDTGAAFMGCLSAIDVNKKDMWQSDPVHSLYPSEKGRNS